MIRCLHPMPLDNRKIILTYHFIPNSLIAVQFPFCIIYTCTYIAFVASSFKTSSYACTDSGLSTLPLIKAMNMAENLILDQNMHGYNTRTDLLNRQAYVLYFMDTSISSVCSALYICLEL